VGQGPGRAGREPGPPRPGPAPVGRGSPHSTRTALPRVRLTALPCLRLSALPRVRLSALLCLQLTAIPCVQLSALPCVRLSAIPRAQLSALPRARLSVYMPSIHAAVITHSEEPTSSPVPCSLLGTNVLTASTVSRR